MPRKKKTPKRVRNSYKQRANREHHALLGSFLQHQRLRANITSDQMAKYLGIHVSTLSRWESGERGIGLTDLLSFQKIIPIHDALRHYMLHGEFPKNS